MNNKMIEDIKRLIEILSITMIIVVSINLANASANVSDPIGDFPYPDITRLDVNISGNNLIIEITHASNVFNPLGSNTAAGIIFMDTDQNQTTGINDTGHGADFVIEYSVNKYYNIANLMNSNTSINIGSRVSINNKKIIFTIPLSLLADDGEMNIFVATRDLIWIGDTFDRVPDYGVLNTSNGLVEVPFPGNKFAGGVITDLNDSGYPDIRKVNVSINKGNLDIVITYKENLFDYSLSKGACAKINLDSDQRLATGFTNTGENPPTFGVDVRINYCVSVLMGTSAYIEKIISDGNEMHGINIGLPYNDGTFNYEGNQTFLSIPLGLLDFYEGNLFLNVLSYNPGTFPSLSDTDYVPDYGIGALNTSDGKIQPLVSCINNWVTIIDPNNDSVGYGYDGDEITKVDVCNAINSIIAKTTLKSFDLDDAASINIYFDIDQNPNTGVKVSNKANTIGSEYMISSAHNDYGILHTYLSSSNNAQQTDQFAIPVGKQIVMTVPLESIGRDDGSVDILAQTSDYPYLEYDIAPNTGIIRLDISPPASIRNLKNITYKPTYINWTWNDPLTYDFSKVKVYINGIWKSDVAKSKQYFNSTGLKNDTLYNIGTRTMDTSGNINNTWVNKSARTAR